MSDRCIYGCDAEAHLYPCGVRCDEHSPWALAGHKDPRTQVDPRYTADALRAAAQLRDRGIAQVTAASAESDREAVDKAIRATARRLHQFSANDVRPHLPAGINSALIGARFMALAQRKEIRKVAQIASTDPGTHGKSVAVWESAA